MESMGYAEAVSQVGDETFEYPSWFCSILSDLVIFMNESSLLMKHDYTTIIQRHNRVAALRFSTAEEIQDPNISRGTPDRKAFEVMDILKNLVFLYINHPSYSPDIAPYDYFLLPNPRNSLNRRKGLNDLAVIAAV